MLSKLTPFEVKAILSKLKFVRSHTASCRRENHIKRYDVLKRKVCACPYYSCGVHDPKGKFERQPTGEITLEKAREVIRQRLETGNAKATLAPAGGVKMADAIADFMHTVRSKERSTATVAKYSTLMSQLAAFSEHSGYTTVQSFDQDAMKEFFASWSNKDAPYKKDTKWSAMSSKTGKRGLKTMRLFFRRCMKRKWITEDPSIVIEVTPEPAKKTREQVKYLTDDQMDKIIFTLDWKYDGMTDYNKGRLKALMLLMRWTGLRISDAVRIKTEDIKVDVLYVLTKKSKVPVQLPLPAELMELLNKLTPYEGGYLFWNRRNGESDIKTAEHNFGHTISKLFAKAGVKDNVQQVSHRFRNTFAVHLLMKGVPLETVSLLLGHQNVQTTENYYADYSRGYMDRAERMLRKVWEEKGEETL
jgi:integrase/recombinase XerD